MCDSDKRSDEARTQKLVEFVKYPAKSQKNSAALFHAGLKRSFFDNPSLSRQNPPPKAIVDWGSRGSLF